MNKRINSQTDDYTLSLKWIGIHALLGIVAAVVSPVAKVWGIVPFLLGLYYIHKSRNRNNEAAIWAAYYVGLEVMLRMTGGFVTYEFGKYAVIILLGYGLIKERKFYSRNITWIVAILILLIPGMLITFTWSDRISKDILFNASGMLALCASALYFYKRPVREGNYKQILSSMILPIVATCFVLFIKTPDLEDISFTTTANFETSGGAGPNQVATVLGLGWCIFIIRYLSKEQVTDFKWLDWALLAFILFRALLTFSRGGNLGAMLGLSAFIAIHLMYRNYKFISPKTLVRVGFFCLLIFASTYVLDDVTDGMFSNRFMGRDRYGVQKEDVTSGRMEILESEVRLFVDNPMGVGVGGSRIQRMMISYEEHNSHNEFGRLLSEHGILGAIIILIICLMPVSYLFKVKNVYNKAYLVLWVIIAFSTMMHSAMRIALPAFFYGFAFVYLIPSNNDSLHRK